MLETPQDPQRLSKIRRFWVGMTVIGLVVLFACLSDFLPHYKSHVTISETARSVGHAEAQEVRTEPPTRKINNAAPGVPGASATEQTPGDLEVPGRTRCMLSRRGIIASAILRPVVEVLVSPGERVTKGQTLIKLYDLEPQAKVKVREKELKSIEAKARYSRKTLEVAEQSQNTGALPFITVNEYHSAALSNEALVLAAEAELALAQSELKLYTLTAAIDGEIAWLDVSPGTVSWPGAMIWGEIVDLSELDVHCDLTPVQADQVAAGEFAEVRLSGKDDLIAKGTVVFVGKVADRNSGLIPVKVRVANPEGRLRAEIAVKVRFPDEPNK